MRKLSVLFSGTMFLALVLSLTAFKTLPAPGPSANGGATIGSRHISFHANTMPGGSVKGSGVVTDDGVETIKFDITCLTITGNQAEMSGTITSAANPALVGQYFYLRVVDNGEGANADPDQIASLFGFASGPVCSGSHLGLLPIDSGNIQVKP